MQLRYILMYESLLLNQIILLFNLVMFIVYDFRESMCMFVVSIVLSSLCDLITTMIIMILFFRLM